MINLEMNNDNVMCLRYFQIIGIYFIQKKKSVYDKSMLLQLATDVSCQIDRSIVQHE